MKMNILMLCEYFFPYDRGGSEWSTFDIAKALIDMGVGIEIFTPNFGAKTTERYQGINIYRFPYYLKLNKSDAKVTPWHFTHLGWWFWTGFCLLKKILADKPQVLHVQGKFFIPQAVIIGKVFKIPVVVTLRDYVSLCPQAYCMRKERNYKKCSLRELLHLDLPTYFKNFHINSPAIKFLITGSTVYGWLMSFMLRFFLRRVRRNVGISRKLSQIYAFNRIPLHTTIYNTFTPRHDFNPKTQNYLLFVGRLTEGKGFPLLLEAYQKISQQNLPPLKVIGGDKPPCISDIPNVEYLGHQSYKITLEYIARAKIVMTPAVWEEPFGRVALEATLLGIPVVSTNRGGLSEIVKNNMTGIIVEPNPAALARGIKTALKRYAFFKKQLRQRQAKLRRKFGFQPVAQYLKIYREII